MKKRNLILAIGIIASFLVCFGVAQATQVFTDAIRVPSLQVGGQGVGGVTYFNGTMINNTTDEDGHGIALTIGDDVRIDGGIFRTEVGGDNPLKISDSLKPTTDAVYSLGESTNRFKDAYLSGTLTVGALAGSGIVTSDNIADGVIATADLADSAVTTAKITDGTIATADLADDAVTSDRIAAGAVTTSDIADEAVTGDKIPSGTISQAEDDHGEGTVDTTTSSLLDTIDDTEITLTTTGGTVIVMFSGVFSNDCANGPSSHSRAWLVVDGDYFAYTQTARSGHSATANDAFTLAFNTVITDLAVGEHTFQVGWNTDNGTTATVYNHTLDVVELKK